MKFEQLAEANKKAAKEVYDALLNDLAKELSLTQSRQEPFFMPVFNEQRMKHRQALVKFIVNKGWQLRHWSCVPTTPFVVNAYPVFEYVGTPSAPAPAVQPEREPLHSLEVHDDVVEATDFEDVSYDNGELRL